MRLNPLEIFLLVLVEFGLATPYDLLSKAGLGPGLTSPVLKRLKEAGLLTSTPGPRKRLRYAMTERGKNCLRDNLEAGDFWHHGQTDIFESLPRSIILAWLSSGTDKAHVGVSAAAYHLSVLTKKRQRDAEELRASMIRIQAATSPKSPATAKGVLIATAYQWMKAGCDAALFQLQEKATAEINALLANLPPAHLLEEGEDAVS